MLTGGGTAGHVMPHIAMLQTYTDAGFKLAYIGSDGIEKSLIENQAEAISFYQIQVGKLRRYLSFQNVTDIFRILVGFLQSLRLLSKLKPVLVFSKGGFVSVPVAYAAKVLGIPIVSHESDLTPGLANKLITPIASRLLYSFPDSKPFLPENRSELVGIPVRRQLLEGNKERACKFLGFDTSDKPTILVMGGSLGAQKINETLLEILPQLVERYRIVHVTGRDKKIAFSHANYRSFEFLHTELGDVMALCDLVISRAGANSIFEFLALKKPMILIPLEAGSRGDQIQNADCFRKMGVAQVLREAELKHSTLLEMIEQCLNDKGVFSQDSDTVPEAFRHSASDQIMRIIGQITTIEGSG